MLSPCKLVRPPIVTAPQEEAFMLPFRIASSRLVPVMVLLLLALMFAVIGPHAVAHAMNCPGTPLPC